MRRKRKERVMFWPSLAATAIVGVLFVTDSLRQQYGMTTPGATRLVQSWQRFGGRGLSTRAARPPQTLDSRGAASPRGGDAEASPSDRGFLGFAAKGVGLHTEFLLAPPSHPGATARLHAPVRDEREELAGLAAPAPTARGLGLGQPVSHPSSARSNSTADAGQRSPMAAEVTPSGARTAAAMPGGERPVLNVRPQQPPAAEPAAGEVTGPADAIPPSLRGTERGKGAGAAWPRTPSLDALLVEVARHRATATWAARVRQTLGALQSVESITDPRSGELLAELGILAEAGLALGEEQAEDRPFQERLLRAAHSVHRRAVVWNSVWRVGQGSERRMASARPNRREPLDHLLADIRHRTAATGDAEAWESYLLLDQVSRLAEMPDAHQRRIIAQRWLSRIEWDGLQSPQRQWLDDPSVHRLAAGLRPWAASPVEYAGLLAQLERQESDALDLGGIEVAAAVQSLRFAGHAPAADVAESINTYYRNANIRVAVSAELLQRLLPEVPSRTQDIRQTILGTPVRGAGKIDSRLAISLVPSRDAWQLDLHTLGTVNARTSARRGPVSVSNRSHAAFAATTPIRVDRGGFQIGDTDVSVDSRTQLGGLRTDYDGFPIIDSLVRGIALSQYQEAAGQARRQSESVMRGEISRTVTAEVDQQISDASDRTAQRLLGPLGRLQLAPLVVDLETTESRLAARYRVAGDWQLAAFTPRPRAMSDSLLSLQVHQSALNNTFEQLAPGDGPQPIRELVATFLQMFGAADASVPAEIPEDVSIQFASTRPVTVEIDEDRLWLTLRIVRLTREGGIDLSHFIVRAAYRADVDGLQARLVRDGGLRISGPRMGMRERLPVRAIFHAVLAEDRPLPLVSPALASHRAAAGLEVRSLQLTDGWIGLAIAAKRP